MKKESTEILNRKFTAKEIKQRDGGFGKQLSYIETHSAISRLNEAFDNDWSFSIVSKEIIGDHAVVHVQILVKSSGGETITKDGIGGKKIMKRRGTNEYLDIGNDFKSACSDALKVASRLFGVGLHLYSSDDTDDVQQAAKEEEEDPTKPADENQVNAIEKIAKSKKADLPKILKKHKVSSAKELTFVGAKAVITELNAS